MGTEETDRPARTRAVPSPPEAIYGLRVLGAWVWLCQAADGFWEHAWAIAPGRWTATSGPYDPVVSLDLVGA
jgi:hypothetical protein